MVLVVILVLVIRLFYVLQFILIFVYVFCVLPTWLNKLWIDNSATGHFVWLVPSPGTVFHWTFVPHLHYQRSKTCSRHIFSHVLTSLTRAAYGHLAVGQSRWTQGLAYGL